MKLFKHFIAVAALLSLIGCGEHGYEGTYQSQVESGMLGKMSKMMPKTTLVIGTDYIETDGKRIEVDEIIVRVSGGKSYLVIKSGQDEQSLEIINENTLKQDMGLVKVIYKRD